MTDPDDAPPPVLNEADIVPVRPAIPGDAPVDDREAGPGSSHSDIGWRAIDATKP